MSARSDNQNNRVGDYVTMTIGGQLFGLPITQVHDVFIPGQMTKVPLAPPEIAGILNLRGRIVTAIDMRCRLGLPKRKEGEESMAVGIDCDGESYGLVIDAVGEVLRLADDSRQPIPANLDSRLARVAADVHRLEDQLLVVLDVERLLDMKADAMAAICGPETLNAALPRSA
jgi:purine-binding chemotaxis protein CheW